MGIVEVLKYSAGIPYNSAKPDLPPAYDDLSWGLDCFGFVDFLRGYYPELTEIVGTYDNGMVHAAALLDGEFVDAFLRMKEPLKIGGHCSVDTYYDGSNVTSNIEHDRLLDIQLNRGWRLIKEYSYDLAGNQRPVRQPHLYQFKFLNRGSAITIAKLKTRDQSTRIEVIGGDIDEVEHMLRDRYSISIDDVAQMFYQAGQNSGYQSAMSRW